MVRTIIVLGLAAVLVLATGVGLVWSAAQPIMPFNCRLSPTVEPYKTGYIGLRLRFGDFLEAWKVCDSIRVTVMIEGSLVYDGDERFEVEVTDSLRYERVLAITVPPTEGSTAEFSALKVTLACGEMAYTSTATFVVMGEKLKYIPSASHRTPEYYFPELKPAPPPSRGDLYWQRFGMKTPDWKHPERLTAEQLKTVHRVLLDLRDPDRRAVVEDILGPMQDSTAVKSIDGAYVINVTLETLLKLKESGVEVTSVYEMPERLRDSLGIELPWKEPAKQESSSLLSPSGISLDYVEGEVSPGVLPTGEEITFHVRYCNQTGFAIVVMTNGLVSHGTGV